MKSTPFTKDLTSESSQLIGTLISMASHDAVDVLCKCGFDWLFLDLEHSALSIDQAQSLLQVVADRAYVLARVASNTPVNIWQALDIGCDGVIVPLVNSKQEAEAAVRAAKYPPKGERSVGAGRAQGYGAALHDYLDRANEETALVVQVEHQRAIDNLDDILSVDGIDAVFIGPYDLSGSLGLLGQVAHERVRQAIQDIRSKCLAAGMPFGVFGMTPEACAWELQLGARFVVMGLDAMHLYKGARSQLETLRNSL